jgi:alcohol dehydrogenase class IV
MWYFSSPQIIYGEDALSHLITIKGKRALLVTDANLVRLGAVERVVQALSSTGMQIEIFDQVEPDPSLETAVAGSQAMLDFQPDWIIGLGGGSVLDAAKAMWVLYARPETDPEGINPVEEFGLREKARFVAIPTTSGTGSEATWAIVLSNKIERRKLGLGTREALPDYAILDPVLVMDLPSRQTADTGLDALTHAIEGFTSIYHNDFTDGLCLKAAELVFKYLQRAFHDPQDSEAREHMHNAATIAGLGFGNSMAALAHGLGHSLGAVFHVPHGRAVAMFLPYTIEYAIFPDDASTRYAEIAYFLHLPSATEGEATQTLVGALQGLYHALGQPLTVADCGIGREDYERELDLLVDNALNDTSSIMGTRVPASDDLRRLFISAYEGDKIGY